LPATRVGYAQKVNNNRKGKGKDPDASLGIQLCSLKEDAESRGGTNFLVQVPQRGNKTGRPEGPSGKGGGGGGKSRRIVARSQLRGGEVLDRYKPGTEKGRGRRRKLGPSHSVEQNLLAKGGR